MRVLVTAASRRGATFEIAEAIAAGLHAAVGDFRDWSAVDAYAREIAVHLGSERSVVATDRVE